MSDLAKWAIGLAILVSVVAIVLNFSTLIGYLGGSFMDSEATQSVTAFFATATSYLLMGRRLLNCFFVPGVLTALLTFSLFMWALIIAIRTATVIWRYLYK